MNPVKVGEVVACESMGEFFLLSDKDKKFVFTSETDVRIVGSSPTLTVPV